MFRKVSFSRWRPVYHVYCTNMPSLGTKKSRETLKVSFPTISGMPINLPESDFTSDSTWPPAEAICPMCVCLSVQCTNMHSLGTKQHRKTLKMWFPTIFGMAILVVEADLTEIQNGRQACPLGQMFSPALILGPNSVEINLRCHFQLSMLWPFSWSNQIWPQIQYDWSPPCLMFKHAQVEYLSHRVEKQLRCHFQLSLGCSFSWWNLVWP